MFTMIYRASIALVLIALCSFYTQTVYAQVLPGVLQSAAQTATITGLIAQSDGTPVTGASVQLSGSGAHLMTQSDTHGTFIFTSVPYGTYTIAATATNLGTTTKNLVLKGDIAVTIQYVAQSGGLKEIAHVSTQSAGASINVTPASIASVNPSDYAFQGNTSWQQLLARIPGVTVGGDLLEGRCDTVEMVNSPIQPVVLSINGAQPYETSVTLDGMPLTSQTFSDNGPGTGTDLSYIPLATFDTADVVRGPGADAPSIVDSIGGSFVLHAPGAVEKNAYEFSLSNDPYGGTVTNAKVALRFGKLSALITYNLDNSPGPFEGTITPLTLPNGASSVNGQAFYFTENFTAFNGESSSFLCVGPSNSSAWTVHNGSIALSYTITPSITAGVFYAGTSTSELNGGGLDGVTFTPASGYTGSIAPGVHFLTSSDTPLNENKSASLLEEKITAYIWGGVLRLAALQNNSFDSYGSTNPPNGQRTLYGTGCLGTAAANPACPSGGTLTVYNGTSAYVDSSQSNNLDVLWSNNRDLLLSYARQVGSKSSLGLSYVTSYYNDPYSILVVRPNSLYLSLPQPPAVSETTNELRLNAMSQLSDKLSLAASWYFARGTYHVPNPYGGTAQTTSNCCPGGVFEILGGLPSSYTDSIFSYSEPRLGATWRANSNTVIRASAGGGFALPPLADLLGSSGSVSCSGGICTQSLTNLNLQPEKSFAFDVGTDIRMQHDTVFSLDLYRANLYGQFFQSAATPVACSTNPTCPTGDGALPLYITEESNLAKSVMEGINIDLHHDVPRGIYWQGALGLTRGYVVNVPAGFYNNNTCPSTPCVNTYVIPGANFDGYFQSPVAYANGSATIGYRWAPGKYVDLSPTYYGNNNAYFRPAFLEFNAHAGYPLTKNVSLLATFNNITDIYGGSQNLAFYCPCLTAPVVAGAAQQTYGLYGLQYGPRFVTLTIDVH